MEQDWNKLMDKLNKIEQLLLHLTREGAEKDVGNSHISLLSLKQAADFLHLSQSSVYKLIYNKRLIPVQRMAGSRILFAKEHLTDYLKQKQ